jgi:EAL domain-containing protein (putative c-di-GMP-specific phosphodiesterase class I)/GGDEF domain-containing protein
VSLEQKALWAEWLKVKGCLYDPSTGLPALPAVMDDVRRRMESGDPIGLILVDLRSEGQLEQVYGWETYDSVMLGVARALLELKGEELREDETVALTGIRSDQLLIFAGSGRRGFDTAALAELRDRVVERLAEKLQVQVGDELPRGLGLQSACAMVSYDPMVRVERAIYKAIDEVRFRCHQEREEQLVVRGNELRRIMTGRDLVIRYQPIVLLADGSIFGFEALSCGPPGHLFETPEMLFSFAEKTDQLVFLERVCREESVRGASRLPRGRKLFLNCSVAAVADVEAFSEPLLEQAAQAGYDAGDLILEITERIAVTAWDDFRRRLDRLRKRGFGVAIDDMGAGYSSLQSVAEIHPEFLKFDIALVRDIHKSPIKRDLLESLVLLAQKIEAKVIAEGVEQEEEYETLRGMEVTFGQGFFFSPPNYMPYHVPETPA